jgi:nucleoside-diphosphate-sugar epimerase
LGRRHRVGRAQLLDRGVSRISRIRERGRDTRPATGQRPRSLDPARGWGPRRYLVAPTKGALVRIIADAVLINIALGAAFVTRLLVIASQESERFPSSSERLSESISAFLTYGPPITLISLIVFHVCGFYTPGGAYRGRYKALVILQAVSVAFLVSGSLLYVLTDAQVWFPRSVWLTGWLLSLLLVGGARLWSSLLRSAFNTESDVKLDVRAAADQRILVLGGAGFLGSALTRELLRRGRHVTVMDALVYGDEALTELNEDPRFRLIKGDLRDIESVIRALQHVDAVVHLGGLVGDPACDLDEKLTLEINLAATRLLGEAARGFGIDRFIFASSCSVYGASHEILSEGSPLSPISLNARTKIDSESVLLELENEDFAPTVLRFGTLYGLSPRPRFDLVVNLLAAKAATDGRITIFGGEQWRPFLHVNDGVQAILRALEAPVDVVTGQVFNVGSNSENYRLRDLGDLIRRLVPGVHVDFVDGNGAQPSYQVSFDKIDGLLDYTTSYTVAHGIEEVRDVIRDGRIPDYLEARYSNHKLLSDATTMTAIRDAAMSPLYGARSMHR